LGAELVTLGIIHGLAVLAVNSKMQEGAPITPLDRRLSRATPALLTTVLTLVSGALLAAGHMSGLYWLVATMILALVGGVASAWIFLMGDPG
jgi:Ca2+/Na+ antiporter